ncbi:GvpL/GvpF family gas vesicle protein [Streptomyces narbonensis]|uniref:GvpL/GvpF family gas vesicle protein n=1 Tax=Streptomyces narbonensis TaxID=67333 RepID=UPI0016765984|nr:GvpL/GvpF family gas vesicle protein [Streptomyces narbonensis]GGW08077.1 gas vesicle protein [Streptomyces narbonensis]
MNGEPSLTYVYAVAGPVARLDEPLAGLRGVGGAPVARLSLPGAGQATPVFVTSQVPEGQWGEEALRSRFEDLDWLEATARAHHQVIQALAEHTVVLPLRMATLYQDVDRAREALREQQNTFAARLALLAHHTEYGVKVYIAPEAEAEAEAEAVAEVDTADSTPAPASAPSPGKAYLRARRAQHHAREDRYLQAGQAADRIAATAARYATHAVHHPAQTGPLSRGESGENVLNDAYLVPDDQAEDFRAALQQAGRDLPGIRIDITGPWAPYSFAMQPAPPTDPTDSPGARS